MATYGRGTEEHTYAEEGRYEKGASGMGYGTEGTHEKGTTGMGYGTEGAYEKGTTGTTGMGAGGYGRVILTLKSAHNLRDKAWIGKADPYCEVRLADATISTHHVPNAGEHATWDESFAFNNVSPDDVIEFHVYDKNRLRKDAHMGEGSLMLRDLFQQGRMETRVPLSTRTGTKDAGELWVSLRTEGGGAEEKGMGMGMGEARQEVHHKQYATTEETERHMAGTTGYGTTRTENVEGAVCGQEYFSKTEDRPIVRERVTYVKEHRPVEKEFVVETRPTGVVREATEGRTTEHLGTEERVVAEAAPRSPCE